VCQVDRVTQQFFTVFLELAAGGVDRGQQQRGGAGGLSELDTSDSATSRFGRLAFKPQASSVISGTSWACATSASPRTSELTP
jgi:hypothetical protein